MKVAFWIALSLGLSQPGTASASRIVLTTTPGTNSVIVDVHIEDQGGALDCTAFGVRRYSYMPCENRVILSCITRQIGTVSDHRLVDVDVLPNHRYVYEVVGYSGPIPCFFRSNEGDFNQAFDPTGWKYFPIVEFVTIGPEEVPVARGKLQYLPGANHEVVLVDPCPGTCLPIPIINSQLLEPYVDADVEVTLFGRAGWQGNYYGHMVVVDRVAPEACSTVGLSQWSWGDVKQLYRDPAR